LQYFTETLTQRIALILGAKRIGNNGQIYF
jgi:hypothetical protein